MMPTMGSDVINQVAESAEFTGFWVEPRCRICRDETVCARVNELLKWRGVPIPLGRGKTHVVTYADILRDLEPLNEGRDTRERITYNCLWVHAKRHYDRVWTLADWRAWMAKELRKALGG